MMADREKVIKGLECCLKESDHLYSNPCNGCPYEGQECIDRMKADALATLKEQETEDIGRGRLLFLCKTCGFGYDDIFVNDESKYSLVPRYCPNCGRKVKRE